MRKNNSPQLGYSVCHTHLKKKPATFLSLCRDHTREKYKKKIVTLSSIVVLTSGIINNVIAIIYSFVGINK